MSDMLHGDLSSRFLLPLLLLLTGCWVEEDREVGAVELAVHLNGMRRLCVRFVCMCVYKCVCARVCRTERKTDIEQELKAPKQQ